jgi:hypothetical protein
MIVEAQVYGALRSAPVAAIVGDRVHALVIPQDPPPVYPLITYRKLTGASDYALDGPTGDVEASFSVDVWAVTYEETKAVAPVVKAAMEAAGYQCTDDSDDYDDQAEKYHNVLTFEAWTNE